MSASALSAEVDVGQPTLSRWLREARNVEGSGGGTKGAGKVRGRGASGAGPHSGGEAAGHRRGGRCRGAGAGGRGCAGKGCTRQTWSAGERKLWRGSRFPRARRSKGQTAEAKRIRELEKELRRKEKALAEAAALLVLKKRWKPFGEDDEGGSTRARKG